LSFPWPSLKLPFVTCGSSSVTYYTVKFDLVGPIHPVGRDQNGYLYILTPIWQNLYEDYQGGPAVP